jgi:hypothetical protein
MLTFALDGCKWLTLHPACFAAGEETLISTVNGKLGVPQDLSDHLTAEENLFPLQVIKTLLLSHAACSLVTLLTEQYRVTGRSLQI